MRKELGNIKEPTDFEGTAKELAEQVLDLSTKQPDGMIHDADTILADMVGRKYITAIVQYSDQEYCLKHDGVIYEFALKNKTSGANDVLCLSKEDAKKHILKQNLLMEFRNKRFYENDCNLDQLLLMKAGYHYDPTGPMAEHWQKILEYEKDNY